MKTLEERLTELSDTLFDRTTAIDATDCIAIPSSTPEYSDSSKRRRAAVAASAAIVVLSGTGFTYVLTRHERKGVRIETTVPITAPATSTTTYKPTAKEFVDSLPGCVPVDNTRGETVGCVLKEQLMGDRTNRPGMPGLPVYDRPGGVVVGYELPVIGFIPRSIGDDPVALAHTQRCLALLNDGSLDGSPLLANCSDAIKAHGFPDPAAVAHEAAQANAAGRADDLVQRLLDQLLAEQPPPSHAR